MKQASDQDLQLGKWLGGAALGAIVMYLLDPDRGAPLRAVSGEKLRQLGRQTGDALDKVMHGIGGRMGRSNAADAGGSYMSDGGKGDFVNNGRNQDVSMSAGQSGRYDSTAARADGVSGMLRQGVESMQRALAPESGSYRTNADSLTGPARRGGMRGATLAGASVLGMGGLMAPRSPIGMAMGLAGLALLVSATTRRPLRSMLGAATHAQPVEMDKTIRIDASPEQVFDMFANYENFPRFMSNVVEVRDLGNRRSHWVVKGPAGSQFAWNAMLTEHSRPRRLAWESEPGAEVEQSGSIQFEPIHSGTRVTVRMSYRPPVGVVGHAVASLLGRDPERQMDEDLARMKSLVERGTIHHAGARQSASDGKFLH